MSTEESADAVAVSSSVVPSLDIDSVALQDSVVVQRLIEEVRTSEPVVAGNYNRTYNRHNR